MQDKPVAAARVVGLSASQRALLRAIAQADEGVEHPLSHHFLSPIRLAASTGNRAKEVLEQEDLIRQDDDAAGAWSTRCSPSTCIASSAPALQRHAASRSSTAGASPMGDVLRTKAVNTYSTSGQMLYCLHRLQV